MITTVSGLGRCGSSMVMQMLRAGGMETTGDAVATLWEDSRAADFSGATGWLKECDGKAIKILNPWRVKPPKRKDWRWIWIDREMEEEQIKSQHKVAKAMGRKRARGSIASWRRKSLERIAKAGGPVMFMTYESILAAPHLAAVRLGDWCGIDESRFQDMSAVVWQRSPKCAKTTLEGDFGPGHRIIKSSQGHEELMRAAGRLLTETRR